MASQIKALESLASNMEDDFKKSIENVKNEQTKEWLERKAINHSAMVKEFSDTFICDFMMKINFKKEQELIIKNLISKAIYLHDWGRVNDISENGDVSYKTGDYDHGQISFNKIQENLKKLGIDLKQNDLLFYVLKAIQFHSVLREKIEKQSIEKLRIETFNLVFEFVTTMDKWANLFMYLQKVNNVLGVEHDIDRIGEVSQENILKQSIISDNVLNSILNFTSVEKRDIKTIIDVHLKLLSFIFDKNNSIDCRLISKDLPEKFLLLIENRILRYKIKENNKREKIIPYDILNESIYSKTLAQMLEVRIAFFIKGFIKEIITDGNKDIYKELRSVDKNKLLIKYNYVEEYNQKIKYELNKLNSIWKESVKVVCK